MIVPVGSVEQHGPHCPPDVDISIPFHLAVAAAQEIDDFPVLVAPPVHRLHALQHGPLGDDHIRLETFIEVLCDVCRSLKANGFERIVLVNGHGGNVAPQRSAPVKLAEEDVWALPLVYWDMAEDELQAWSETDGGSIGHGGEWETSLQLFLRPQLIDKTKIIAKDDPAQRLAAPGGRFSPELARFAQLPERRREAPLGVMGDPRVASAEKGERLFGVLKGRLVDICPRVPRPGAAPIPAVRKQLPVSAKPIADRTSAPPDPQSEEGQWAWALHRLTGLGVLGFLCMHVIDTSLMLQVRAPTTT